MPYTCTLTLWPSIFADGIDSYIQLLKKNTVYASPYNANHPVILKFWNIIQNRFTTKDIDNLLTFAWGRTKLPTKSADFWQKFTINYMSVPSTQNANNYLPMNYSSHPLGVLTVNMYVIPIVVILAL